MSHPPHYLNRAFNTEEAYGSPVGDELGGTVDFPEEETEDGLDDESSDDDEDLEDNVAEGGVSADVEVQVVVVSPGIAVVDGGNSVYLAGDVNATGPTEGHGNGVKKVKKVQLKSLVIPDHLLHKKYKAPCHPVCTVRSPNQFITCIAIIFFIHGLFTEYSQRAVVGVANRYPFSQMEIRFMNGLEHTGIVVGLVFMSFFSNRFNRPVAVSVGAFICAVGSILCAIPYFAEGQMDNVSFREISLFLRGETCQKYNLSFTFQGTCNLVANQKHSDILAFSFICLGQVIVGLGASLYITNSLVHFEESTSIRDSTVCLGVCLSVHGLGMFGGSLLATGLSTLPEGITGLILTKAFLNLLAPGFCSLPLFSAWLDHCDVIISLLNGGLPLVALGEKVGPWWLGFCITSGLFLLVGFLFLCFPRWFVEPDWLLRRRERYYKKLVQRKKEAERQKRKLLSRRKKEKAASSSQKVAPETTGDKGARKVKKGVPRAAGSARKSRPGHRSPTQGADVIRVPNRNPNFEGSDDITGSQPLDHGAVNPAFSAENLNHRLNSEFQMSPDGSPAHRNQSEGQSSNGQISNGTRDESSTEPTEVGTKTINYIKKTRRSKVQKKYLMRREQFKDISRHIWRLLRNKPLAFCFCGTVLCSYMVTGYSAVLTSYLQIKFHQSQYNAQFATAFVTPLGFCVGTLIGGLIVGGVQNLRENLHLSSRLIVGTLPITIMCMIALMFLSCDSLDHTASLLKNPGNWTCHEMCDCTDTLQDPVCGDDGYTYPSACLAGCHYIDSNPDPMKYTFSTCDCINTPGSRASYGICPIDCPQFYAYVAVAAVGMITLFMGQVPVLMVFLRAVRDRYRSLSIGFGVWLVYLLGYVIGPVIFHEILAFQCEHSSENCQKEGVCWFYDHENLALMLHGVVVMFLAVGLLFFIVMNILLLPGRFTNPAEESNKLALERIGEPPNTANIHETD